MSDNLTVFGVDYTGVTGVSGAWVEVDPSTLDSTAKYVRA